MGRKMWPYWWWVKLSNVFHFENGVDRMISDVHWWPGFRSWDPCCTCICRCFHWFQIRICVDLFLEKDHQDHIEDHITAGLLFISPVVNPIVYVAVNSLYRKHIFWHFHKIFSCCFKFSRTKSELRKNRYQYKVTYSTSSHSGQDNNLNNTNNTNIELMSIQHGSRSPH